MRPNAKPALAGAYTLRCRDPHERGVAWRGSAGTTTHVPVPLEALPQGRLDRHHITRTHGAFPGSRVFTFTSDTKSTTAAVASKVVRIGYAPATGRIAVFSGTWFVEYQSKKKDTQIIAPPSPPPPGEGGGIWGLATQQWPAGRGRERAREREREL